MISRWTNSSCYNIGVFITSFVPMTSCRMFRPCCVLGNAAADSSTSPDVMTFPTTSQYRDRSAPYISVRTGIGLQQSTCIRHVHITYTTVNQLIKIYIYKYSWTWGGHCSNSLHNCQSINQYPCTWSRHYRKYTCTCTFIYFRVYISQYPYFKLYRYICTVRQMSCHWGTDHLIFNSM